MRQSLLARNLQQPPQEKRINPVYGNNIPAFNIINGKLVAYDDNQQNYIIKGYNVNDIVYSIIRLITDKARVAPWGIYKVADEGAYKSYLSEQRKKTVDIRSLIKLQHKALTPVANAGKWGELIKYPNPIESYNDQVANAIAFKLLTGNKYKWAEILTGGANQGTPNAIWLQPSQYIKIYTSNTFPVLPIGYFNTIFNIDLLAEQVLHEKYFNPNYDLNGSELYGMAPLKAGLRRLQKSNSQIAAEASSWGNEGIKGIVTMKNKIGEIPGEEAVVEVERLAKTLRTEWQGEQNRGRMGLSGYDLDWIPIGLNSEEMELIDSGIMDLRYLCNLFGGVPSQLLNDPENKVYNNSKEGEKALTSRCVLPELCSEKDSMNRKASTFWGLPKGQIIDFDMTVFSELSADAKEVTEKNKSLTVVIPNEEREEVGLAAIDDPIFNEGWIMVGGSRVPLSEYQNNSVDNALNDNSGQDIQPAAGN